MVSESVVCVSPDKLLISGWKTDKVRGRAWNLSGKRKTIVVLGWAERANLSTLGIQRTSHPVVAVHTKRVGRRKAFTHSEYHWSVSLLCLLFQRTKKEEKRFLLNHSVNSQPSRWRTTCLSSFNVADSIWNLFFPLGNFNRTSVWYVAAHLLKLCLYILYILIYIFMWLMEY